MTPLQIAAEIVLFIFFLVNLGFYRFNTRQYINVKKELKEVLKIQDTVTLLQERIQEKINEFQSLLKAKAKQDAKEGIRLYEIQSKKGDG